MYSDLIYIIILFNYVKLITLHTNFSDSFNAVLSILDIHVMCQLDDMP